MKSARGVPFLLAALGSAAAAGVETFSKVAAELKANECGGVDNCGACYKNDNCQWCAPVVKEPPQSFDVPFGHCIPKTDKCDDATFGTVKDLATAISQVFPQFTYQMNPVPSDDPELCTTRKTPEEMFTPTCNACFDYGATNKVKVAFCETRVLNSYGGVCIPEDLSFLCETSVLPPVPMNGTDTPIPFFLTGSKDKCGVRGPKPTPKPETDCSKIGDCRRCNAAGCTFCGGSYNDKMNVLGTCIDADSESCAKVKFGTLFPGPFQLENFEIKPLSPKDGDLCTTVQWPADLVVDNCKKCIESADNGWCQMTVRPTKTTVQTAGMCMPKGMGFICSGQNELVEVTYVEKGGRCGASSSGFATIPGATLAIATVAAVISGSV